MKHSYLTAGITLGNYIRLLRRNRISFRPRYLFRTLFILQSTLWSSLFALTDRLRFGKKLLQTPAPKAPVFIIGHWRTGSTFLHQLLALDPQLKAPTLFEVAIPDGFLTSHHYYKPVMAGLLTKYRPMDKVKIGMDEPQEDEYAIYRITGFSPLERLVFPKSTGYFLHEDAAWVPAGQERRRWMETVSRFYSKITFGTSRTLVSKNPFNSMRIPELLEMFPDARLIHIVRHPYEVIPSTINMWTILQRQNALNPTGAAPDVYQTTQLLGKMLEVIRTEMPRAKQHAEIRYEDFLVDPVTTIKTVYQALGLEFLPDFKARLTEHLRINQDFERNAFSISPDEKEIISSILSNHMDKFGYKY